LNVITDRIFADSGDITLDGESIHGNDHALGSMYMLGEKNYYPETMKVREALDWAKLFYPNFDSKLADKLVEQFKLPTKTKIVALSTGYQTIFKIVIALAANTPIMLLDEPVLGLDAQHRDMFYKLLIERFSEKPCTIVISTHLISEVANIIEHCIIIKDGHIVKDAPCDELLGNGYSVSGPATLIDEYLRGKDVLSVSVLGGLKTACISGDASDFMNAPQGIEIGKLNLQDYFIGLMNSGKV